VAPGPVARKAGRVTSADDVRDARDRNRYEITVDDRLAGFAAYRRTADAVEFTHTEIEPDFEGRGLASTLVRAALDDVKREGLAVRPYCPFVRSWIARHPDYVALVPAAERAQFDLADS
jgi:predicted GNAT family acetyltransferase